MRALFVHPSALMYSEIFLRLEPLGLERAAAAARSAGHQVRALDLQVSKRAELDRELSGFEPEAVGFSLNYLANVPEVIDLALLVKARLPRCFVFVGGHSVSFIAAHVLEQAEGAIDAIVRGDGEVITPLLLEAARDGGVDELPGVVTAAGTGKGMPLMLESIDDCPPARDLMRRRRSYFIGELGSIREPNVFIVDDVAFIKADHGDAIAEQVERRGIRKRYYLETRADVLLRNAEVFERWRRLGLEYMFLGIEALDERGLELYRKRITPDTNMRALEEARRIGITVALNLIVDPQWDREQFGLVREFALSVPEIVHLTVITPYPGTELWHGESQRLTTLDYRLFDIQHAVLPTRLPLREFYEELVRTQAVISRKHLGMAAVAKTFGVIGRQLLRGQTNFLRMLWKFNSVYNADRQYSDHLRECRRELPPPQPRHIGPRERTELYVHRRAAPA